MTMTYQWKKNGVNLSDGGDISGSLTTNLTISSIGAGDAAPYDVIVSNASGMATSTVATLTVTTPIVGSYAERSLTNKAVAYW